MPRKCQKCRIVREDDEFIRQLTTYLPFRTFKSCNACSKGPRALVANAPGPPFFGSSPPQPLFGMLSNDSAHKMEQAGHGGPANQTKLGERNTPSHIEHPAETQLQTNDDPHVSCHPDIQSFNEEVQVATSTVDMAHQSSLISSKARRQHPTSNITSEGRGTATIEHGNLPVDAYVSGQHKYASDLHAWAHLSRDTWFATLSRDDRLGFLSRSPWEECYDHGHTERIDEKPEQLQ